MLAICDSSHPMHDLGRGLLEKGRSVGRSSVVLRVKTQYAGALYNRGRVLRSQSEVVCPLPSFEDWIFVPVCVSVRVRV